MRKHPAAPVKWRDTPESSNIAAVGWTPDGSGMYIRFKKTDAIYFYEGVSRQRVVACSRSKSAGQYVNHKIIKQFRAVRVT